MRASFVFSEVITGLRRNITMTIAMILTTAISLGLLGGGLLIVRLIDKVQNQYYDKLQVGVTLSGDLSANDKECAQDICSALRKSLQESPLVDTVTYESRDKAFQRFKEIYATNRDLVEIVRPEALPASFRVKLKDPTRFELLAKEYQNKPGVAKINDQRALIDQLFSVFNGLRNTTFFIALVQALAALLLISNTIQVSAFTRRTEVGIMRLVGATRWYTQLPFLIEAVVAGFTGALLAVGFLATLKATIIDSVLAEPVKNAVIPGISMGDVLYVSPWLFLVGVTISAVTGYVTLRLYVRQ
ncbi:cell division transport system permease protein [Crossiella equi]|uniref:Cell division protein FtsX n=1 Tax=Crossiella equi TaxID=130796 RepID=A0ABS5AJ80_9PSEU|nr:permease-like cell division protein FtsX [Crossiella equi]MBP2476611.1 cell division transport system permease protein [Crossiella equi]